MSTVEKPWDLNLEQYESESHLLEGLRRRDRTACTSLLQRFMPRLYRLALRVTGDPDEAEDVLQESFIQACGHIDNFQSRGGSGLGSWLYRIVLNTALMHLRKRKGSTVRLGIPLDEAVSAPGQEIAIEAPGPADHALSRELREKIDEAMLHLPDSLRAAFVLRDLEGLSTAEAAGALGISETALKVRLHRARLALREELTPYLEGQHPALGEESAGEKGVTER